MSANEQQGHLATLKRDTEHGGYTDTSGCWHEDGASVIGSLLGFCGCGCPEDALKFVRDVLAWIDEPSPQGFDHDAWQAWYKPHRERGDQLFHGDDGLEYFTLYMLADKKLTEHGGSVPGWLSERGKDVLFDLQAMNLDETP